jgi:hypothetical protein
MWTCPNNLSESVDEEGLSNTIGTMCKQFVDGERNVVLLFGGVGTHKGDLTDVMVSEYNFHVICMEEMVRTMVLLVEYALMLKLLNVRI